jgi:hypothetical protein
LSPPPSTPVRQRSRSLSPPKTEDKKLPTTPPSTSRSLSSSPALSKPPTPEIRPPVPNLQLSGTKGNRYRCFIYSRVVDPDWLNTDPDPALLHYCSIRIQFRIRIQARTEL